MKNAQKLLTEIEAHEKVLLNEKKELLSENKAAKPDKAAVTKKTAK